MEVGVSQGENLGLNHSLFFPTLFFSLIKNLYEQVIILQNTLFNFDSRFPFSETGAVVEWLEQLGFGALDRGSESGLG